MIQQVRELRTTERARVLTLAMVAVCGLSLAGIVGYEVGAQAAQRAAVSPAAVVSNGGQPAAPLTGLQP